MSSHPSAIAPQYTHIPGQTHPALSPRGPGKGDVAAKECGCRAEDLKDKDPERVSQGVEQMCLGKQADYKKL